MTTTRLTTAAAIVRYLIAQRTVIDDVEVPLFPGVFAIFGHVLDRANNESATEPIAISPTGPSPAASGLRISRKTIASIVDVGSDQAW